jgi:hypothetical protein
MAADPIGTEGPGTAGGGGSTLSLSGLGTAANAGNVPGAGGAASTAAPGFASILGPGTRYAIMRLI